MSVTIPCEHFLRLGAEWYESKRLRNVAAVTHSPAIRTRTKCVYTYMPLSTATNCVDRLSSQAYPVGRSERKHRRSEVTASATSTACVTGGRLKIGCPSYEARGRTYGHGVRDMTLIEPVNGRSHQKVVFVFDRYPGARTRKIFQGVLLHRYVNGQSSIYTTVATKGRPPCWVFPIYVCLFFFLYLVLMGG